MRISLYTPIRLTWVRRSKLQNWTLLTGVCFIIHYLVNTWMCEKPGKVNNITQLITWPVKSIVLGSCWELCLVLLTAKQKRTSQHHHVPNKSGSLSAVRQDVSWWLLFLCEVLAPHGRTTLSQTVCVAATPWHCPTSLCFLPRDLVDGRLGFMPASTAAIDHCWMQRSTLKNIAIYICSELAVMHCPTSLLHPDTVQRTFVFSPVISWMSGLASCQLRPPP